MVKLPSVRVVQWCVQKKKKKKKKTLSLSLSLHGCCNYIKPDVVHVMIKGRIVQSGGAELAKELEEKGYDWLRTDFMDDAETGDTEVEHGDA